MRHYELSKNGTEHKNNCAHAEVFTALKVFIMYYLYNKELNLCWAVGS